MSTATFTLQQQQRSKIYYKGNEKAMEERVKIATFDAEPAMNYDND